MPKNNSTSETQSSSDESPGRLRTAGNTITMKKKSDRGNVKTRERPHTTDEEETEDEKEETGVCPECAGDITHDSKHGEQACEDCGLVVDEDEIDRGPEWRTFNSNQRDEKSRVGSPTNKMMHDDGLATNIDWRDKDGYGQKLGTQQRKKMQRLRKWNQRAKTQDSRDRNLKHALGEIERMSSALGLPRDVREISSMIYRRCLEQDMLPGRSIEGMATASLYAAGRMEDIPRSLKEMTRVSRVDEKEIGRAYRYIDRELSLGIGPSDPLKYIPRFAGKFDEISQDTERLARRLVERVKDAELHSGKTPPGIAAAAIYMAAKLYGETPTQEDLAEVTGVTEVTIRERYQDIIDHGDERWIHTESEL